MTTLIIALTALVASLVSLGVAAFVTLRRAPGSPEELASQLRQQRLDLDELFDRVDHWQRRDRVRKLRDGQAKGADPELERELKRPLSKDELRALAFGDSLPIG